MNTGGHAWGDAPPCRANSIHTTSDDSKQTNRPPIGSLIPATPCTTTCTRACTSERPPRSIPAIVRPSAPIWPPPPASPELAESAGFVKEKPPVSSCDIGGRQSGRGGSNSRHSAWEAECTPDNPRRKRGFAKNPQQYSQRCQRGAPPRSLSDRRSVAAALTRRAGGHHGRGCRGLTLPINHRKGLSRCSLRHDGDTSVLILTADRRQRTPTRTGGVGFRTSPLARTCQDRKVKQRITTRLALCCGSLR